MEDDLPWLCTVTTFNTQLLPATPATPSPTPALLVSTTLLQLGTTSVCDAVVSCDAVKSGSTGGG
ncbi:hypothetical protein E2C01_087944 [Portunus trituberculatus]|uniref:Uncharacterized protein n=1 Tax=Portunus trituberculatus TaxID=210409 RepID=A0A5B7JKN8_PORTR|nr:hypothetical protein [Portunus trituberculatus]